jgi:Mrp family chromosome partitioning ATPase
MEQIQKELGDFGAMEISIADLERQKTLQETYLHSFSANLFNERIDQAMGSDRLSNISVIQRPTPPIQKSTSLKKVMAMLIFGTLAGGLAVAFGFEFYLDRSFRRPAEIENQLRVPLFLSIPLSKLSATAGLTNGSRSRALLSEKTAQNGNKNSGSTDSASAEVTVWNGDQAMPSYFETLRDRLILYFESLNLVHKPKLVAVTSCAEGSGVSTVARGVAASLSETGDGNVLLVDMNETNGNAAAFFHKGQLQCGLDDALEGKNRDGAMVQQRLYVVSEKANDSNLPRTLHKRFSNLMPKLRASDYDYIIFDMPPVSQISPTPRLAQFMDMVFLVVEAERTDRDVVKRATDLLVETKTNVGVILNKTRAYVPRALLQEL